jgi:hAT family C-terminal dimerisation region
MALDLFSIDPMMSAECERVFSSAKNLITDHWNKDIIEACTLLRHWFRDPEA